LQPRSKKLISRHTHTGNGAPRTGKNLQEKGQTELSPPIPLVCHWLLNLNMCQDREGAVAFFDQENIVMFHSILPMD